MQILYNGADITQDISVNACLQEMYADGQGDALTLRLNDKVYLLRDRHEFIF